MGPYKPGDNHAMLIFCRQPVGSNHDWALAEAGATSAGWKDVSIQRAGTLNAEALNGKDAQFREAFEGAIQGRCGIIVYQDPLTTDDA